MSQDQPSPPEPRPPGGRPPGGSSRRRRRGRGGGGGGGGGGAAGAGGAGNGAVTPQPATGAPRPSGGGRSGRGGRGSGRGGGGGGGDRSGGDRSRAGNRGGAGAGDRGGGGNRGGARRQAQQQPQPQAVRELEITDEKIFPRLLDAGLDLSQEAVIEAFLYFTGEGAARRVAAQLEEGGFATYVDPNPPGRWLLEAVSRAVPTPEHIAAMGTGLRNLARSNNGTYDGWWASEPPEEDEAQPVPAALEGEAEPIADQDQRQEQARLELVTALPEEEAEQVLDPEHTEDKPEPVAASPEEEPGSIPEDSPEPV